MVSLKEIVEVTVKERNFLYTNAPVFLYPEWLDLFPKNTISLVGIYDKGDSLIGGFCYFKGKKLGKTTLGTPQFFAHNGLFYINPSQSKANKNTFDKKIMKAVCDYLKAQKTLFISLGFPHEIKDVQPFIWNNYNISLKYTYQIKLDQDPFKLLEQFSSERRKNITKAEKDNVRVELSEDYKQIESLVSKSINRKDAPVDKNILQKIIRDFSTSNYSYSFVAYVNNKPSATVFIVHDSKTAYYLLGGFDEFNKHQGAGAICMWHAIQHAKNLGIKTFDFEGSMLPEVEKYFRGFGGDLKPLIQVHSASYFVQTLLKSRGKKGF